MLRDLDRRLHARTAPDGLVDAPKKVTALRDITALGGDTVLATGGTLLAILLALAGQGERALGLVVFLPLCRLVGWLLKATFRRARPPSPVPGVATFTSSFPSIHTLNATCLFSAIGFAAGSGSLSQGLVCGAIFGALVGTTRLLFAVHWLSDVLGGLALGLLLSSGGLLFVRSLG